MFVRLFTYYLANSGAFAAWRLEGEQLAWGLSPREAEVLAWVANGKTNAEIGTILRISSRTVGKHLERIYQKLGVETRMAAARWAMNTRRHR